MWRALSFVVAKRAGLAESLRPFRSTSGDSRSYYYRQRKESGWVGWRRGKKLCKDSLEKSEQRHLFLGDIAFDHKVSSVKAEPPRQLHVYRTLTTVETVLHVAVRENGTRMLATPTLRQIQCLRLPYSGPA
jgi:hypothetical protein